MSDPFEDLNELLKQVEGAEDKPGGSPASPGAPAEADADDVPRMTDDERRDPNVRLLLDVQVPVRVLTARTTMSVEQLSGLRPGQILEFDKTDGEPMEIVVGDTVIGRGDTVKVGEHFGVRITALSPPEDIIRSI